MNPSKIQLNLKTLIWRNKSKNSSFFEATQNGTNLNDVESLPTEIELQ